MMEVVRGYEQELSATCAEISLATGRLRLAASQAELAALAATLEGLFQDAEETVEQVELESHGPEAAARARVAARVTSYQAELRRQRDQVQGGVVRVVVTGLVRVVVL